MDKYQEQANDFLKKTKTEIIIEFLKNDYHFLNDEYKRDIYKCTIKRGNRKFTLDFGQSVMKSQYYQANEIEERTYTTNGKSRTGRYNIYSLSHLNKYCTLIGGTKPTNYDILSCITKYDPVSLEEFCHKYGYDSDSKTAEKIYDACVKEWDNVCTIWNDEEIDLLRDIE